MKEYNPAEIEAKWQEYWEKNKTFKTEEKPGKEKFYCLDFFPYPSGAGLHIGHPLGYTATDIYSRYKRMKGFSVLHPMGFDAFGLPAEQHAISTGEHPGELTEKNCERFVYQMKKIGLSYDWDREIASCREDYYHWTQWVFLKLYNSWFDEKQQRARPIEELNLPKEEWKNHRLAYYADAMVNWCPALGTVLSNEEVIDGKSERGGHEVVRKPMKQWILRITAYAERLLGELEEIDWPEAIKEQQRNWIGKKHGAEIDFKIKDSKEKLIAFTTRPDTLFGVTFFVISPEHPAVSLLTYSAQKAAVDEYCQQARRLSEFDRTLENRQKTGVFTGGHVINPITGEEVPVYVGDYVLMSYGTGAVMGVPAHDQRDYEFAKKFKIPIRNVVKPKNEDLGDSCWTDAGVMIDVDFPVAKELKLAGVTNEEAKKSIVSWLEKNSTGRKVTTYKLRDWLFSRQRYWGEPIPVIHWEDGEVEALTEKELPLLLPSVQDYLPSDTGESPLAKVTEWVNVIDPKSGRKGKRETNIMPQWAGSCWYYLRFIDPKNSKAGWNPELEKAWMPVDLYVGGAEHAVLHLLYARFWHKVLYDLGLVSTKEPFKKLFNQGMIVAYAYQDQRGAIIPVDQVEEKADNSFVKKGTSEAVERVTRKMSKSLKNVIDPLDIISQYGADTLRMYLMFMGPLDAMRPWDSKAIQGSYRFLKRAWAFVSKAHAALSAEDDLEVKRLLHLTIKKVSDDIENLRMNTGISTLMEFVNGASDKKISKVTLETFVLLLSPYAPHLAEELWAELGHSKTLSYEKWPSFDPSLIASSTALVVIQINGKKRGELEVPVDIEESALKAAVIDLMKGTSYPVADAKKFITVKNPENKAPKLVNIVL